MKVVFTLLSIVLMSIVSGLSYAGPFGTQMGDQKDVFSDLKAVPLSKVKTLYIPAGAHIGIAKQC